MEFLAALIGSRLCKSVIDALGCEDMKRCFWSDSTMVLAWITKEDYWSIFIRYRIQETEIRVNLLYGNIFPVKLIPQTYHLKDVKSSNLSFLNEVRAHHGLKIHMSIINI